MTSLNIKRHVEIFNPDQFTGRVDIIGCGATGSHVALSLAKLGVRNVRIWDGDIIESHNIPNQAFSIDQIGKHKVSGILDLAAFANPCLYDWTAKGEHYTGQEKLGDIVFLLVDSMETRKEIWERDIKLKAHVKLMIETRLDPFYGRLYSINPSNMEHIKQWESTLYTSEQATVSACGASQTLGPTANIIANMAVIQFIRWHRNCMDRTRSVPEKEIMLSLDSMGLLAS